MKNYLLIPAVIAIGLVSAGADSCSSGEHPSDQFDLSHWKITLPVDENQDGKPDDIHEGALRGYTHPDFFYLDDNGHLVFTVPNQGVTTPNSTNTRSELRQMVRG